MNARSEQQTSFQKLLEYEQRSLSQHVDNSAEDELRADCSCVVFRLGEHHLALPIDNVGEILELPRYSNVPGAKPWILGLSNIRGSLVTVCDLLWFVSGIRSPLSMRSRLVVTNLKKHPVGLIVDEVLGQRHFNLSEAQNTNAFKKTELKPFVSQQFNGSDESWGFFNLESLLEDDGFLNGAENG